MSKKLWALNLLLLVVLALVAREVRRDWLRARWREERVLNQKAPPPSVVPPAQQPAPAAVQASNYLDVAQNMLFSKDRNPTVVVEPPKEKPTPAFPRFYGVMNLGDGLMAILSDGPGRQRPFKAGDKVGEFKLSEIGQDTLVFEWDQKKLPKKFSDLQDRGEVTGETTRGAAPAAGSTPPVTPPAPAAQAKPGPGTDIGGGLSACNANDATPAGTVVDGKRKVVSESPFGKVCRWEPVK